MKNILYVCLLPLVVLIAGCESDKHARSPVPGVNSEANLVVKNRVKPLRYSPVSRDQRLDLLAIDRILEALTPDEATSLENKPNGEVKVSVLVTPTTVHGLGAIIRDRLERLGLTAPRSESGSAQSFEKIIKVGSKAGFIRKILNARKETALEIAGIRGRMVATAAPGLLPVRNPNEKSEWLAGRLVYTGQPLDLALPAPDRKARYFFPIILSQDRPALNLKAGDRAFCRTGRLFVDERQGLSMAAGQVMAQWNLPTELKALRIEANGEVVATLADEQEKISGQIELAKVSPGQKIQGDGQVFVLGADVDPTMVKPGAGGEVPLRVGHLEFPDVEQSVELHALADQLRLVRILNALQAALETSRPPQTPTGPTPMNPVPAVQQRQIVLAADVPSAVAHMKALGMEAKTAPGRTTFTLGNDPEALPQFVAGMSKVLRGLNRRMAICQENYTNAERTRDQQRRLSPYRRQVVNIGKDGEILIEGDPSPFRTVEQPENKDAGPDGKVVYPNVDRAVEAAEYKRVSREYDLIRTVLERVAPDLIFPAATVLQTGEVAP